MAFDAFRLILMMRVLPAAALDSYLISPVLVGQSLFVDVTDLECGTIEILSTTLMLLSSVLKPKNCDDLRCLGAIFESYDSSGWPGSARLKS